MVYGVPYYKDIARVGRIGISGAVRLEQHNHIPLIHKETPSQQVATNIGKDVNGGYKGAGTA